MSSTEARLHEKFESALRDGYEVVKLRCGYSAIRFLGMLQQEGGVVTAKRLLDRAGEVQSGVTELWECGAMGKLPGALNYTVEAIAWKPEFRELFSPEELAEAKKRLQDLKYQPPWADW